MKIKCALLALSLVLLTAPALCAQQQPTISECSSRRQMKDALLQNALQKSVAANSAIELRTDDSPCRHAKHIVDVLNRTINKKSFNLAVNHSFSAIKNGESSFTVERFIFKNTRTAAVIGETLSSRSVNTLQMESLTLYDFFVVENNLILFIADRQSFESNKPLFNDLKAAFQTEYKLNHK